MNASVLRRSVARGRGYTARPLLLGGLHSGVRATDGQAADETEEAEVEEGEAGMTEDEDETDAGYIEAAADGDQAE